MRLGSTGIKVRRNFVKKAAMPARVKSKCHQATFNLFWLTPPPKTYETSSYPAIMDTAVVWLAADNVDANGGSAQTAGSLVTWGDKNGNHNFSSLTEGERPTLRDDGGGLWAVVFDGGNDLIQAAGCIDPGTNGRTTIIAGKYNGGPNGEELFSLNDKYDTNASTNWAVDNGFNAKYWLRMSASNYAYGTLASNTITHLFTFHCPTNGSPQDIVIRVDGTVDTITLANRTETINVTDSGNTSLGYWSGRGSGNVEIYEFLHFDSELSASDISDIEGHLNTKYSIY